MQTVLLNLALAGFGLAGIAAAAWIIGRRYQRELGAMDAYELICTSNDRADRAEIPTVWRIEGNVVEQVPFAIDDQQPLEVAQ